MRRFLTNVALATVAMLALTATTKAADKHGPSNSRGSRVDRDRRDHRENHDYVRRFGTRFDYGYFYSGREHRHWTYSCYWTDYGCDCHYCPYTACWYYWYASGSCYYPVSYSRYATPTKVVGPVGPVGVTATALAPMNGVPPAPPVR
jgi:hypothetical protein